MLPSSVIGNDTAKSRAIASLGLNFSSLSVLSCPGPGAGTPDGFSVNLHKIQLSVTFFLMLAACLL